MKTTSPYKIISDKMQEVIADITLAGRNTEANTSARKIAYALLSQELNSEFNYIIAVAIEGDQFSKINKPGKRKWLELTELLIDRTSAGLREQSATMKRRYENEGFGFENYPIVLADNDLDFPIDVSIPKGCGSAFLTYAFDLTRAIRRELDALLRSGMGPLHSVKIVLCPKALLREAAAENHSGQDWASST